VMYSVAASQRYSVGQCLDLSGVLIKIFQDIRASRPGSVEAADVTKARPFAALKQFNQVEYLNVDLISVFNRHVHRPVQHRRCEPWLRFYRSRRLENVMRCLSKKHVNFLNASGKLISIGGD